MCSGPTFSVHFLHLFILFYMRPFGMHSIKGNLPTQARRQPYLLGGLHRGAEDAEIRSAEGAMRTRRRDRERWGMRSGEGVSPPQPTRESGERRKLHQRGQGRRTGRKRF